MYRKLKAHNIFNGFEFLGPDYCLTIKEDGTIVSLAKEEGDEFFDGILMPGLINCHCHLELSHLKSAIPQHTGLVKFVQHIMKKRHAEESVKQTAMNNAEEEMYQTGTVAVGDICNSSDTVQVKKQSAIAYVNFIEVAGFVDATAQQRLDALKDVFHSFEKAYWVPHAPYSVSPTLFRLLNELNRELITIHNQENKDEDSFMRNRKGLFLRLYEVLGIKIKEEDVSELSSFEQWISYFNHHQRIISVHNTFLQQTDLYRAKQYDVSFCLCPRANLYIENKFPPVELLRTNDVKIVLGTDSLASNHDLKLVEEMKTIQENDPSIPLEEILRWSTSNGAYALRLEHLGSFKVDTKPGVVLLSGVQEGRLTSASTTKRIL